MAVGQDIKGNLPLGLRELLSGAKQRMVKLTPHYRKAKKTVVENYRHEGRNARFLLLDTPAHGNIGDQAIAVAEQAWLKQHFASDGFYEIPADDIDGVEEGVASLCPRSQVVLVHGGGFLGHLWPNEEYRFRRIIKAFRNNSIIVFPQTATFDVSTKKGRSFLEASKKAYEEHSRLTICLREKASLSLMQKYMAGVHTQLMPDMVLSMPPFSTPIDRDGVLFCMRHDHEKSIDADSLETIRGTIRERYPGQRCVEVDTVADHEVRIEDREAEVGIKLAQFAKASLVVTDRLHGMIFAALTNTPCVAFNNSNRKVENVYEWLQHLDYIKFTDRPEALDNILCSFSGIESGYCASSEMESYFQLLKKLVNEQRY